MKSIIVSKAFTAEAKSQQLLCRIWLVFLSLLLFSSLSLFLSLLKMAPHNFPIREIPFGKEVQPKPVQPPTYP